MRKIFFPNFLFSFLLIVLIGCGDKPEKNSELSYSDKTVINAAKASCESIRGAMAGFAVGAPGFLFPQQVPDWATLVRICNANGATLRSAEEEQGLSLISYEAIKGGGELYPYSLC